MNLIEVNGYYINTDRIDVIRPHQFIDARDNIYYSTDIFVGGSKTPFNFCKPIDEVVKILEDNR